MVDPQSIELRRELGRRLRVIRTTAGFSGPQLAERVGRVFTQSKISRIENGALWPPIAHIQLWLEACDASPDDRHRLLRLAEAIETGVTNIRELARGSLVTRQRELAQMDQEASTLRQFSPALVAGLFQGADYARACIEAANLGGIPDVERAVQTRIARGARLRDAESDGPRFHALLMEAALRWRPAGASFQAIGDTLRNIVAATAQPHITVQVIPLSAPMAILPQGSFMIIDWKEEGRNPVVLVETPAAEITFTGPGEVSDFRLVWDRALAAALTPAESAPFIERIAAEFSAKAP